MKKHELLSLYLSHLIKKFLNKNSISKRIFDEEY